MYNRAVAWGRIDLYPAANFSDPPLHIGQAVAKSGLGSVNVETLAIIMNPDMDLPILLPEAQVSFVGFGVAGSIGQ